MKAREKKAVKNPQNGMECSEQPIIHVNTGYRAGKVEMLSNLL